MRLRTVAGLLLIVLSIVAMYFWETRGRDRVLLVSVVAAAADIKEGTAVGPEDFKVIRIIPGSSPAGALSPQEAPALYGRRAGRDIAENVQVLREDFLDAQSFIPEGRSVYVIPSEWIFSRSSSLRAGDRVDIYSLHNRELLGNFPLAFVRDSAEKEVEDAEPARGVLDRKSPGSSISSLEIICTDSEYFAIFDKVAEFGPQSLLVVMEESAWEG